MSRVNHYLYPVWTLSPFPPLNADHSNHLLLPGTTIAWVDHWTSMVSTQVLLLWNTALTIFELVGNSYFKKEISYKWQSLVSFEHRACIPTWQTRTGTERWLLATKAGDCPAFHLSPPCCAPLRFLLGGCRNWSPTIDCKFFRNEAMPCPS